MLRKFIFKSGRRQLTLPVTPPSFSVQSGRHMEKVNIHEAGDVVLAGNKALGSIKISCMFPERDYYFAKREMEPYAYIAQLEDWIKDGKPVRFIVSGTTVNRPVLIESISYGEQDGTNDIYATIALQDWQQPKVVEVAKNIAPERPAEKEEELEKVHEVEPGDTLCSICRYHYNDGSYALAVKLNDYNNRPNPNIIHVGNKIRIPPRAKLGG